MARSLTVHHDEKPATSSLFTGFLVLAIGWLLLAAWSASATSPEGASVDLSGPGIVSE